MQLTIELLKEKNACESGIKFWKRNGEKNAAETIKAAAAAGKYDYCRWIIRHCIGEKSKSVAIAIYAAELVLPIFDKKYPEDLRPRKAIEAAKTLMENRSKKTSAYADASAAYAAAYAAYAAAVSADDAAADAAAYAAAYAAASAAYAAYADDADDAADASAAIKEMWGKLVAKFCELENK